MNNNPVVTVLMPVYNGEKYLREAIDSILSQTFTDFEFLIIDDCSSDSSIKIIRSYSDTRIFLLQNEENLGQSSTANIGIRRARGKYIVRLDCDDISLSHRVQTQIAFMDKNPDVVICGSNIRCFGEHHDTWNYPEVDEEIRCALLFDSSFASSSVVMRRDIFIREKLFYNIALPYAEDYDLWSRVPRKYKLANLPEILVKRRLHSAQITNNIQKDVQFNMSNAVRRRLIESLGVSFSAAEIDIHNTFANLDFQISKEYINEVIVWSKKLLVAVKKSNIYDYKIFEKQLLGRLNSLFFRSLKLGPWIIKKYFCLPFSKKLLFMNIFENFHKIISNLVRAK